MVRLNESFGVSIGIKPSDVGKFSASIIIPTIVTSSIDRVNLTTPLCRYNERVLSIYALKSSEKMRAIMVGAGVATIIAAAIIYYFATKKKDNKPESSTNKHIFKEGFIQEVDYTVIDFGDQSILLASNVVDIKDDIFDIVSISPDYYKAKSKKLASFTSTIMQPTVICFLEEYESLKETNNRNIDKFNYVIVDSLMDNVASVVHFRKEIFYTSASLDVIKRQTGYSVLDPTDIDKLATEYKRKRV